MPITRSQRVFQGRSPVDTVIHRIQLNVGLANPFYKPDTNQDDLTTKVEDILFCANEVSQPDNLKRQ